MTDPEGDLLILEALLRSTKENPITSKKLGKIAGISSKATGRPSQRAAIKRVIEKYQLPVGASPGGYFMLSNEAELAEYVSWLDGKIDGIRSRISLVCVNYGRFRPRSSPSEPAEPRLGR